jgi:hypothetical protein
MKRAHDKQHREVKFAVDDWVWLLLNHRVRGTSLSWVLSILDRIWCWTALSMCLTNCNSPHTCVFIMCFMYPSEEISGGSPSHAACIASNGEGKSNSSS